jgi:glycosyltransferase involved in cell wall biosynthesis
MPVFNGGQYFRLALESALAQDYSNLEIIVVNDGSKDGGETERIALSYGDRVRYILQENRGTGGALNTAVAHMTGDFFAWLSHDDLHLPHKTSAQIAFWRRLGCPSACLFSDYDLIDPVGELITTVRLPSERIRQNPRLPLVNGFINGCTLLIPAAIIRAFGPFNEALRYTQDYDLWNQILTQHEFFHQPEVLIRYRLHPGQDTNKPVAAAEAEAFWRRMVDSRTEDERTQMFGSTPLYFESFATILNPTPFKDAFAHAKAAAALSRTKGSLVSVIIPFYNEVPLALRAARSALDQVEAQVEVILVDDGSTESTTKIESLVTDDPRVSLLRQINAGPAAARNAGMNRANGSYVAFLDADDVFLPTKITRQLDLMRRHGSIFSHTSYYVSYPGEREGLGLWRSGAFGGSCYPAIIGSCPIATPTVMLHRSVLDGGFFFPTGAQVGEDVLAWIDLAARYLLLGVDEPLSIVEWSDTSAALSPERQALGLSNMIEALESHPVHRRHREQIGSLRRARTAIAREWAAAGRQFTKHRVGDPHVAAAWATNPDVPPADAGRAPPLRA